MNTHNDSFHILVVDDELASLSAIERVLVKAGYENLLLLSDSSQIFECLSEFRPDLIITDLEMPEVDGFGVLRLTQEMTQPGEILPVLVITGNDSMDIKRRALAAGATDFLSKPCDPVELQTRVRNLLRMRSLQQHTQNYSEQLELTVAERTKELTKALADLKESQRHMMQEERLRAFAAMAGGVVHDFNNTLMTISGYSGLLLREPEIFQNEEELRRTVEIINQAATDAGHVVDRLREFYSAREAREDTETIDFNTVVEEAVQLTQPKWHSVAMAEGRRIDFDFDFSPVPAIAGRKAELREILVNLIFNAVDAMPKGGTITCGTRSRGSHVVFELADNGVGMTPEVLQDCKKAFFTTKGEKGTGLGLSMVASIVERHGGHLEIQSTPGAGTLVRIGFPVAPVREEPQAATAPEKPRALKIMVVDDDPHMRNVVSRLLAKAGHSVTQVSNGQEALAQTERARFDLLLTDHAMPGMTGLELASLMRGVDPNQRVILFTGYPMSPKDTPRDIACLLKKPAQPDELQLAIARAMAS